MYSLTTTESMRWITGNSPNMWQVCVCLVAQLCLTLATPWTVAHQAPLSMGFPRQEYWSVFLCPPPGDLPDPEIEPKYPTSPELTSGFLTTSATWGRRQWHPTPVLLPGKSHGQRSLVGYSPGSWRLDMTEWLHFHFSLSCSGEGNGNPLQCSCLENPRDGGAWWAAFYGIPQSRAWLKRLSSSSSNTTWEAPRCQAALIK